MPSSVARSSTTPFPFRRVVVWQGIGQYLTSICCYPWVWVTLRPTGSRSVSLGVEPHLGLMTRYYLLFVSFGLLMLGAPSDEGTGLSFVIVFVRLLLMKLNIYKFIFIKNNLYTRPLSVQAKNSRSCPILSSSGYNGSLVTWTVVRLTATKFKHLVLCCYPDGETVSLRLSENPVL
jgi:hypothetical protein